jgi:hypothetical protein
MKISFSIILLSVFLLSACESFIKSELPPLPDLGITQNILNADLEMLFRPSSDNTFKIGDAIVIDIHLKSDIQVKSDASFLSKLYLLDKKSNKWVEVPDFISYGAAGILIGTNEIILTPDNPNCAIVVSPIVENKSEEVTLLVTIKGEVLDNKKNSWVGSYIVVNLKP